MSAYGVLEVPPFVLVVPPVWLSLLDEVPELRSAPEGSFIEVPELSASLFPVPSSC
jgi:hypothetical protein